MFPRDDGMTLEKGAMVNPETGIETEYEEIWEDLSFTDSKSREWGHYVLMLDEEVSGELKQRTRGFAMQLGSWFQVVVRRDKIDEAGELATAFTATRWKWDDTKTSWGLLVCYRLGDLEVPLPSEVESELKRHSVAIGGNVHLGRQQWTCKELNR
jgi:hypothetical protein